MVVDQKVKILLLPFNLHNSIGKKKKKVNITVFSMSFLAASSYTGRIY